jgi:nucleotide-binding universal stress UspA family protein
MAWEVSQMRRPIVVAVDGSEGSLRAAEWAAREAARRDAPLRIVSAPGPQPRVRTYQAPPDTVANALRGIAARALAAAVERVTEVAPEVVIDTDLLAAPPAVAVSDSGAGAQLLVVGARGAGGFAALTLGSVSRHAAACAPCPIVVVREDTMAVHREIVVGVGDPDDADDTLGFAFEEAALRGANLTAVHAAEATAATAAADAERHLEAALRSWQQKYPDVSVSTDVVRSHPARVLASLSARADLVIIGRHGTAGGAAGSLIQHAVLGHAHGPVAIVPAGSA